MSLTPYYQDEAVTIYHGDAGEILPRLQNITVILTDPPWELSASQVEIRGTRVAPRRQKNLTLQKGVVGIPDMKIIAALEGVASHDCLILAGYKELAAVCQSLTHLRGVFAWHKPNGTPAAFYPARIDLSFIVWGGTKSLLYGHQHWPSMVFSFSFPQAGCMASERYLDDTGAALHPCQGPIKLYKALLRPFSTGLLVCDPYMGTGTTLRAAKDVGLKAVGIEIEERWCELAAKRMSQEVLPLVTR